MSCCSCFRIANSVRERNSSHSDQEEKSNESFQHISRLEPKFTDLLVRFGLLSNAAEFEKSGYRTIEQVSKMTEKDLSFLKPLQRRKFQAAINEAMGIIGVPSPTVDCGGSFDSSFVEAFIGEDIRPPAFQVSDVAIISETDVLAEKEVGELVGRILRAGAQEASCSKDIARLSEMKEKGIKRTRSLACATLAFCYRSGHGVEKDGMLSDQLWKQVQLWELALMANMNSAVEDSSDSDDFSCGDSFDKGSAPSLDGNSAQFLLGLMDEDGLGYEKDRTRHARDKNSAARLYLRAAKDGLPCAQHALAVCLFYGDGVPEDKHESVQWDKIAAEQGNAAAQYALGVCYDNGEGVNIDESKAYYYYKLAVEQDYALAQFTLGQCYEYGSGTKEDIEEALRLYSAAAAQGNRDAKEAMKGLGSALVNSPATVRAANVCRSVFEKPTCLITAQEVDTLLTVDSEGNTCESGLVIDVGIKSVGHALTMATAATCFYFGYGVEEDYAFAKQLWRCADVDVLTVLSQKGEEGSAVAAAAKQYAAYLLGGMLIIGQGRAGEDEEEGAILLTRASAVCKAEGSYHPLGLAHAQFSIGACHYFGVGVEDADTELGVAYFKQAAVQGHQEAIDELERLKIPAPPLLEGLPPLVIQAPAAKVTLTYMVALLRTLISRFEGMDCESEEAIENWRFVTEKQVIGNVPDNSNFSVEFSKCSADGLIGVDGRTYRLGAPHATEVAKLQKAQQQVHKHLNKGNQVPRELPALSVRVQSLLTDLNCGHSPVSVLAVASVEIDLTDTQALLTGRKVRESDKQRSQSATLIQSVERRRQQTCQVHRGGLLTAFTRGVHTGNFLDFVRRTETSAAVLGKSVVMQRARHISTILQADASVRWLGFSAPRHSRGSMSRFMDFDERSWKSLHWTPYAGAAQLEWLEEEFPFGFLVGQHAESYREAFPDTEPCPFDTIVLDSHFADSPRYSRDLYTHPVDMDRKWRVHTGKGNFFLVLHLTGPAHTCTIAHSGVELSVCNTEVPLVNALIDLNTHFESKERSEGRHSKVMAFRFCVKGEQPAITLQLAQHLNGETRHDCGYVCGLEVVMDTTDDSLWWTKSDFYSHTHVEDVDEHEAEMEKYRQAADRTTFEVDMCRRAVLHGTKEGVVSLKRKTSKLEAKYTQKHISFNPVSRLMSCYDTGQSMALEWTRHVTGRASIYHEHADIGFTVTTCDDDLMTHAVVMKVGSGSKERDAWLEFINTKTEDSSHSPPRMSRRHSSSELDTLELDGTRPPSSGGRVLQRCQSADTVREAREPEGKLKRSRRKRSKHKSPLSSRTRSAPSNSPNSPPSLGSRSSSASPRTGFAKGFTKGSSPPSPRSRRVSADSVLASPKRTHPSRLAPPAGRRLSSPRRKPTK